MMLEKMRDYFSLSDDEEAMHRQNLTSLKAEQGICDDEFYHYDTPLTVKHEAEALLEAGGVQCRSLEPLGSNLYFKGS